MGLADLEREYGAARQRSGGGGSALEGILRELEEEQSGGGRITESKGFRERVAERAGVPTTLEGWKQHPVRGGLGLLYGATRLPDLGEAVDTLASKVGIQRPVGGVVTPGGSPQFSLGDIAEQAAGAAPIPTALQFLSPIIQRVMARFRPTLPAGPTPPALPGRPPMLALERGPLPMGPTAPIPQGPLYKPRAQPQTEAERLAEARAAGFGPRAAAPPAAPLEVRPGTLTPEGQAAYRDLTGEGTLLDAQGRPIGPAKTPMEQTRERLRSLHKSRLQPRHDLGHGPTEGTPEPLPEWFDPARLPPKRGGKWQPPEEPPAPKRLPESPEAPAPTASGRPVIPQSKVPGVFGIDMEGQPPPPAPPAAPNRLKEFTEKYGPQRSERQLQSGDRELAQGFVDGQKGMESSARHVHDQHPTWDSSQVDIYLNGQQDGRAGDMTRIQMLGLHSEVDRLGGTIPERTKPPTPQVPGVSPDEPLSPPTAPARPPSPVQPPPPGAPSVGQQTIGGTPAPTMPTRGLKPPVAQGERSLADFEGDIARLEKSLRELGAEPPKPSSEAKRFGVLGRDRAPKEAVARYDAEVKAHADWTRRRGFLIKQRKNAQNALEEAKNQQGIFGPSKAQREAEVEAGQGELGGAPKPPDLAGEMRGTQQAAVNEWLMDQLGGTYGIALTKAKSPLSMPPAVRKKLEDLGIAPKDAWEATHMEVPPPGVLDRLAAKSAAPPALPEAPSKPPQAPSASPADPLSAARARVQAALDAQDEAIKRLNESWGGTAPQGNIRIDPAWQAARKEQSAAEKALKDAEKAAKPARPKKGPWEDTGVPDLTDPTHVSALVHSYGGIKVGEDLAGELRGVPAHFKSQNGLPLDRIAESIIADYPHLGERAAVKDQLIDTMTRGQKKAKLPKDLEAKTYEDATTKLELGPPPPLPDKTLKDLLQFFEDVGSDESGAFKLDVLRRLFRRD